MATQSGIANAAAPLESLGGAVAAESAPVANPAPLELPSFESVVRDYQSMIFGLCLSLLGHRQDAEDMTQETFSRFYRYRKNWDPTRPLGPYLRTIAGNRCRTLLSRRGRKPQSLEATEEPRTVADDHDRRAECLREELKLALAELPEKQRRAFELFHVHAMPYAEIATTLGCPLGSVKTWVHRARTSLIEHLRSREVIAASKRSKQGRAAS